MSLLIQPQNHGQEKTPYTCKDFLKLIREPACWNTDNCCYIYNILLKRGEFMVLTFLNCHLMDISCGPIFKFNDLPFNQLFT